MKSIKIITILILLLGFVTAYSQQTGTGLQNSESMQVIGQQDRSTLSPNPPAGDQIIAEISVPVPGSQSSLQLTIDNTEPVKNDGFPSPNPLINTELSRPITAGIQPELVKVENQGPRPNDPNGVRPDTK